MDKPIKSIKRETVDFVFTCVCKQVTRTHFWFVVQ